MLDSARRADPGCAEAGMRRARWAPKKIAPGPNPTGEKEPGIRSVPVRGALRSRRSPRSGPLFRPGAGSWRASSRPNPGHLIVADDGVVDVGFHRDVGRRASTSSKEAYSNSSAAVRRRARFCGAARSAAGSSAASSNLSPFCLPLCEHIWRAEGRRLGPASSTMAASIPPARSTCR
jgi:hypothetical protein